ncbi:MAG: glycosyltransferase [Candidatus Eisenbacteria bacterium]|nr:glycosyltransferase [Candidatus Eisenbacteria bacterium]
MSAAMHAPAARPLVSVLLASRDGARHLDEALASLTAQTYAEVELVLVDDGSRDETLAILARFAASHPRATVIHAGGGGLAAALAQAAAQASGDLLARHDDDDRSHPERLARQVEFLASHASVGVVGTGAEIIDDAGARIATYPVPTDETAMRRMLRRAPPFVHGSVMMRRDVYRRAGGYRGAFRASQDLDLWMRLPADAGLANLPDPLYAWRHHPRGVFSRARDEQLFYAAVARAFRDERAATGSDAIALLERSADPAAFIAAYPRAAQLERYLGEAYVREGRPADARRHLAHALADPDERGAALGWWLTSWPVAFTPRARRAAARAGSAAGAAARSAGA